MNRRVYRIAARAVAGLAITGAAQARAEDLLAPRTNVAGSRTPPEYTADGVRLGSWTVAPQMQMRGGYDSNLFGADTDLVSSAFFVAAPSLRAQNDWGNVGMGLSANANLTRYVDHVAQNTNEYSVRGGGNFTLGDIVVQAAASLGRAVERRGTNGSPLSVGPPSLYRAVVQHLTLTRETGPVSISAALDHQTLRYSDLVDSRGRTIEQGFRDSDQWGANARVNFVPSDIAGLSLYVSHELARIPEPNNYKNKTTTFGGAAAIDTGMFRLSVDGGRVDRRFGNPAFRDFSGWTYDARLDWYPTPLLTIGVRANRGLESSGNARVGSLVARNYSAQIDYELLRNFTLQGQLAKRVERFREIGQSARSFSSEMKGEFSFNRFVAIGAYGRHECKNSSVTGTARRFCVDLIGLSLTLRR